MTKQLFLSELIVNRILIVSIDINKICSIIISIKLLWGENRFHLPEIRPQGGFQLRNLDPDFMDFLFIVRLGNPKKDLQNCSREQRPFFLLIMRACARQLFLRRVFQILFRIFQSNGKNESPKSDISALKSVFKFRVWLQIWNPDFKI